jgi:hypothetical protein
MQPIAGMKEICSMQPVGLAPGLQHAECIGQVSLRDCLTMPPPDSAGPVDSHAPLEQSAPPALAAPAQRVRNGGEGMSFTGTQGCLLQAPSRGI